MTAPGSHVLQLLISLGLVVPSSYVAGRIHQWYVHILQRDAAFRQGYDDASESMFELAMRQRVTPPATTGPTRRTPALVRRQPDAPRWHAAETPRTQVMPRSKTTRRSRRRESFPE